MTRAQQTRARAELRAAALLSPAVLELLAAVRKLNDGPLTHLTNEEWEIIEVASACADRKRP